MKEKLLNMDFLPAEKIDFSPFHTNCLWGEGLGSFFPGIGSGRGPAQNRTGNEGCRRRPFRNRDGLRCGKRGLLSRPRHASIPSLHKLTLSLNLINRVWVSLSHVCIEGLNQVGRNKEPHPSIRYQRRALFSFHMYTQIVTANQPCGLWRLTAASIRVQGGWRKSVVVTKAGNDEPKRGQGDFLVVTGHLAR